jgi:hypothetical protein
MKNTATYLNFKYRINQLRDSEKWFVINRLVSFINYERLSDREQFIDEDNKALENHLRYPSPNTDEWWMRLRELSVAPLFYQTLRQI